MLPGAPENKIDVVPENKGPVFEVGKTYMINHCRKGRFEATVIGVSDEWVDCVIYSGAAKSIKGYNLAEKGEAITIRKSFCNIISEVYTK